MKKFKAHRQKGKFITKILFFLLILAFSYVITIKLITNFKIKNAIKSAELKNLLFLGLNINELNLDIFNVTNLLENGVFSKFELTKPIVNTDYKVIDIKNDTSKPIIYIYNTHETEKYKSNLLETYNISYTVQTASFILADYLRKYGIECYVETDSVTKYLNANNLKYSQSYDASRHFINKRLEEYDSIKYIIDLHRDSGIRTTYNDNEKKYAKLLFLIGLENENYESNLQLATSLNSLVPKEISRGILKKGGKGVNGIYNQDIIENAILIEVGSEENEIIEVDNSLEVLSNAIFKHLQKMGDI